MTGRDLVIYRPPRNKGGRPTLYDESMCERVVEYGREGMCREEIAAALGINHSTFSDWASKHSGFTAAIMRAKELEYAWWLKQGRIQLANRNFNAQLWALQMRNRFGDRFRIRDAEPGEVSPQDAGAIRAAMERKLSRVADAAGAATVPRESDAR